MSYSYLQTTLTIRVLGAFSLARWPGSEASKNEYKDRDSYSAVCSFILKKIHSFEKFRLENLLPRKK